MKNEPYISISEIRNKLGPIQNLITMLESDHITILFKNGAEALNDINPKSTKVVKWMQKRGL